MLEPIMPQLRALTREDLAAVLTWRDSYRPAMRTPMLLTPAMQEQFYLDVVSNRNAPHRYFAVDYSGDLVGLGGLTYIQWENGLAELALGCRPGESLDRAREAVHLLLDEGFQRMRLETIFVEKYMTPVPEHGLTAEFWKDIARRYNAYVTVLPRRKWWDGKLWDSVYVSVTREEYLRMKA